MHDEQFEDIAEMFVEKYLGGFTHSETIKSQIREMLSHKNTSNSHLASALMYIGKSCQGNKVLTLQCFSKLYLEFRKRNNYFVVEIDI